MAKEKSERILATNRQAYRDYKVIEVYEAGIVLAGNEVKSLRSGKANLKDSYIRIDREEAFAHNIHISPYIYDTRRELDSKRVRKLLLHKAEIQRLLGKVKERGYTMVPLKLYLKGRRVKIEIALVQGKKLFDKRRDIAEKTAKRDLEREFKERNL